MRNFASTLVKFSKLSHIPTTIWRPPKLAPPRAAGSAGPFVTPLAECTVRLLNQAGRNNYPYNPKYVGNTGNRTRDI